MRLSTRRAFPSVGYARSPTAIRELLLDPTGPPSIGFEALFGSRWLPCSRSVWLQRAIRRR